MRKCLTDLSYARLIGLLYAGEFVDLLRRDRSWPAVPPHALARFVGGGDFLAVGQQFLQDFRSYGGLSAHDRVLDIGSGVGRMAVPFVEFLQPPEGSYDGFDISPPAVRWCRRHISSRAQHFRFTHADVYNHMYNRGGRWKGEDYRWPYPDATFTFAFATSLFTHIRPPETVNYVAELGRTLAPAGRAFLTFFVLDSLEASRRPPEIDFVHRLGVARVRDAQVPEEAVGYPLTWLTSLLDENGLQLDQPVLRGSWSGGGEVDSFQDIVLVSKRA